MKIIAHRRNTIELLEATPAVYGVEVDIRTRGADLIIHHDPFQDGPRLSEWLAHYRHSTLILNVKEEGLEAALLAAMERAGIEEFFFLDQSFPFLIKTSSSGERRSAVRVSEYEGLTGAQALAGKVEWAWIDCFRQFPLNEAQLNELKELGYKLCLVSPELQGRPAETEVPQIRSLCADAGVEADAVCTKRPELWT